MSFLRHFLRFQAALQLLPALESAEETLVGGQAVLEGVMMRTPHAWGIAVRKTNGEVITHHEPLDRPSEKSPWKGWPFIRGLMTLGQAMGLGFRALKFSADVALEEEEIELSNWALTLNVLISVGFFIFMYKLLPYVATQSLHKRYPATSNQFVFALVEGAIRLSIFLGFIWLTSRFADIRRVYQYHGAEHKTVFAFESQDPLECEKVQKYSTFHPRCGTSFLMTIMLISIVVYALVPVKNYWAGFGIRLALLPFVVATAYEIIRYAAKRRSSLFAVMTAPGLWLQRITTKAPDDQQVGCAISALETALALEKERGGELVIA